MTRFLRLAGKLTPRKSVCERNPIRRCGFWDSRTAWVDEKLIPFPHLAFLHGNVAVAYCDKDHVMGSPGKNCPKCHRRLIPSKLLFPIKHKDYNHHMAIRTQWSTLQQYMKNAYMFTIFGYSAPKSDVEAVGLMKLLFCKRKCHGADFVSESIADWMETKNQDF